MKNIFLKTALLSLILSAPMAHALDCQILCLGNNSTLTSALDKKAFNENLNNDEIGSLNRDDRGVAAGQMSFPTYVQGADQADVISRAGKACEAAGKSQQLTSVIPVGIACGNVDMKSISAALDEAKAGESCNTSCKVPTQN
jgi:hypothetical protein